MAYSVNWLTKVVTIPKADLTAVSANPEIYELNVLDFWSAIHDIQDGEGITYDAIMRSNAPVTISGVTYVRSVEVINGYTIEFENGAYQVNLIGANNNIPDVRVQNNVSLSASNSAGLAQVGSGLDATQNALLNLIARILQGDEEFNGVKAYIRDKDTKEVLVEKDVVTGTTDPVHLREPQP